MLQYVSQQTHTMQQNTKSMFEKLEADIKRQGHEDVVRRYNKFPRKELRKWEPLISIIAVLLPFIHTQVRKHRQPVKEAVRNIVGEYEPTIHEALKEREYWFRKWEQENSDPKQLSASEDTRINESKSLTTLVKLCFRFIEELKAIEGYDTWFHPIENPMNLVENPYPGFLCTLRARNYVRMLKGKF